MDAVKFLNSRRRTCDSYPGCNGCELKGKPCPGYVTYNTISDTQLITKLQKRTSVQKQKRRRKMITKMEENMKVENGKIIEITEQELYSRYIDGEYYMALDFNEYKWRMENAGTKIVK